MEHDEGENFYFSYTEFKNYNEKSKTFRATEISKYTKSCAHVISDKFQEKTSIKEVFTKIKKILEHYKNPNSQNSNKYYGYINYWLSNNLTENDLLNKNTTNFCNEFKSCDSDVELLNKKFSDIKLKQNDVFERINELYSVYDDYFSFISFKSYNTLNCFFAERCVNKYNIIVDKYASNDKSNLLNELQNLEQLFNQNGIFSLQGCEKNIPTLKSLPAANKSKVISSSLSSSSLVPIPVIAATVGLFPLLLLLYKHTPLVSLLYNLIIGKKNMLNNVAQENHELSYFTERNKVFADNESYHLIYSSADYS